MQTRSLVIAVYVLAAAVLAGVVVYVLGNLGPDPCSPEMREQALSQDAADVLAGRIRLDVSVAQEQERMIACGD